MRLFEKIPNDTRLAIGSVFLVVNAVTYVFFAENILNNGISTSLSNAMITQLFWLAHFLTLAVCLILGISLTNKLGRTRLFLLWTVLGVVSPFILFFLNFSVVPIVFAASIFFAASIGLGMPSCMEYFIQSTKSVGRGHYAGFILLTSALALFLMRLIGGGIELTAIILVVWRFLGLLGVFAVKPFTEATTRKADITYRTVIGQRSFLLYIVPWAMFSLVNYLTQPVQLTLLSPSMITYLQIIENAIAGISAIAGGFLVDYVGRKQAAIAGFVMLGLSYSILGIYPREIMSWYFYTVFDGITWGLLTILFVITIWGELNQTAYSDKYYAIGILPFFFSQLLSDTLANYISSEISSYALFSFTAFFLFIGVLPLLYAPETLPEKVMKDRDLKSYVEKAKKKAQREAENSQKKAGHLTENNPVELQEHASKDIETSEDDEEYEQAKKLAEKYY